MGEVREKKKQFFLLRSGDGCASMKTSHLRVDTCLLCLRRVFWASIEKEKAEEEENELYIFVHKKQQQQQFFIKRVTGL